MSEGFVWGEWEGREFKPMVSKTEAPDKEPDSWERAAGVSPEQLVACLQKPLEWGGTQSSNLH